MAGILLEQVLGRRRVKVHHSNKNCSRTLSVGANLMSALLQSGQRNREKL